MTTQLVSTGVHRFQCEKSAARSSAAQLRDARPISSRGVSHGVQRQVLAWTTGSNSTLAAQPAVWALSFAMLLTLLADRALHWTHHRDQARAH
ncbi:hypothetical protein ACFVGS_34835, partial [Streptomyces sp. NPDC127114]